MAWDDLRRNWMHHALSTSRAAAQLLSARWEELRWEELRWEELRWEVGLRL